MKQLKDYLHLYPKAHLIAWDDDGRAFDVGSWYIDSSSELVCDYYIMQYQDVKVSLLNLSDMTEEEKSLLRINVFQAISIDEPNENVMWTFEQTKWLMDNYFDVFGLIEAGLAIDKTSLK